MGDLATVDLQGRLTAAERALEDARSAMGAALLDEQDDAEARRRELDARGEVEAILAAIGEATKRAGEAEAAERRRQEQLVAWRYTAWYAEYVERIKPVLELRPKLEEAEKHARAMGSAQTMLAHLPEDVHANVWLDEQIETGRIPELNQIPGQAEGGRYAPMGHPILTAVTGDLTPADCGEWSKRLKPVVAKAAKEAKPKDASEGLPWSDPDRRLV